jgi:hypothetical protein
MSDYKVLKASEVRQRGSVSGHRSLWNRLDVTRSFVSW